MVAFAVTLLQLFRLLFGHHISKSPNKPIKKAVANFLSLSWNIECGCCFQMESSNDNSNYIISKNISSLKKNPIAIILTSFLSTFCTANNRERLTIETSIKWAS